MPPTALCVLAALALCTLCAGQAAAPALRRVVRRLAPRLQESYDEEVEPARRPAAASAAAWPFQPIQVNVDVGRNAAGVVPLVVVPLPVPMPGQQAPSAGCDATSASKRKFNVNAEEQYEELYPSQRPTAPPRAPSRRPPARPESVDNNDVDEQYEEPARRPQRPQRPGARYPPPDAPPPRPYRPQDEPRERPVDRPQTYEPEETETPLSPRFPPIDSSQQLVEEFRAQSPKAPELPPMLLSEFDGSERAPAMDNGAADVVEKSDAPTPNGKVVNLVVKLGKGESVPDTLTKAGSRQGGSSKSSRQSSPLNATPVPLPPYGPSFGASSPTRDPPRPRFDSLPFLRGHVTVPRADYTEPYAVWYDQASGATRVDYHGGATSTFRYTMADGRVRRVEVRVERSGEGSARRCAVTTGPRAADRAPLAHPALPDLQQFSFAGYEESEGGRVEVWRRSVQGRAGEQGGARGEALLTRHELRLLRSAADLAVPLRYTVAVDSSTLGPDTDGYEHFYQVEGAQPVDPKFFEVDMDKECDTVEYLNASSAEDAARLEPLREFTRPHRDLRYDEIFNQFKIQFQREYVDEKEEAVRKNVVIQSSRFAASGNRQGATAELGLNLLGDRLGAEVRRMQGLRRETERRPGEAFPHSRDDVRAQEKRLPSGFDWRERGGVTPVRNQGANCASCWAFAVVGAVEGALFRRTRRLVALSEQSLIDCAHPYGGKGCKGTWPSHAYNYVEDRGLPAQDEYPAYKEKVGTCVDESVPSQTRISSHVNVTANSVPALKVAIRRHAPSVVIVDANCKSFILYKKGVLYDDRCGKTLKKLDHAVVAVGWGERQGEPHFILKNSWSAAWGKGGYVRVHARSNTCGVLTKPSYPRLEDADVEQPLRPSENARRLLRTVPDTDYY